MKNILLILISSIISTYIASSLYALLVEQRSPFNFELLSNMSLLVFFGHLISIVGLLIYAIYSFSLINKKKNIFFYIGSAFTLSTLNFIGIIIFIYFLTDIFSKNLQTALILTAPIGALFIVSGALTGFFHYFFVKKYLNQPPNKASN